MDVATGAMGSLLPKMKELCLEEHKLSDRVKQDVADLCDEIESMQTVLLKIAGFGVYQFDPQTKIWAAEAKEVSYLIDDVVDSFQQGSKPANLDNFKGGMTKKVANTFKKRKTRIVFADALQDIWVKVTKIHERSVRYKVYEVVAHLPPATIDPRQLALYQNTKYIIGIEESSMDLIKKISCYDDYSSPKQLKILSIFGSMGLGKTTLAKLVYDKLKGEFSCGAFVSAGCKPDVTRILRDLLFELGGKSYLVANTLDARHIIVALQKLLAEKRYLIVVDDLWDISTWETIKCALLDNDCGSSVIITTRNFQVGRKAGEVYKMKPLSHEKSEELFYDRLFGGKVNIPDQLVDVSKLITKKCGCIPLAIITMAALLMGKPRETWYALYNSIGFGHGDTEEVNNTRMISLFSYYDLPSRLRNCLLHLSLFPEGYMIWKDTLIWKWIAEGFIHKSEGVGLFEIGESYFYELINRSLVQPVEIPHSGIIIGCRVNVIVLDMICFLSKQENFVMVLDSHERDTFDWIRAPLLAIQNRVVQENEMPTNPHVRSFNATKCELQMMPSLTRFQHLRVLALEDCASIGGIYHLEHIRKLVHLRYLGLFNTPICELPQDIGNLQYLQTLDLRQTKIEELPHAVVLLSELKCLRAGSRSITVPDGMGNLASLEELQLSDVSSSQNTVKELGKLKKLRDLKLCIRLSDERSKRDLVESLGNLQKIKILHLDGGLWIDESYWKGYVPSRHLRHVYLGMKFSRLPAWISPLLLPDLSHLSVDISVVEEEDLLILGSFPELLYLSLVGEHVCLPDIMGGDAFPRLKYCYTSGMVRFLNGAAPELESVSFNVRLWGLKDGSFDLKFRSLLDHPLLQVVRVEIFYTEAHLTEVDEVEAALSDVVHTHPNCPILDICKWKSSVSEQFGSHYDVDGNDYYDDNEEDNDHEYYYDEE